MSHFDLDRIATLARLNFSENQAIKYQENMRNLLNLVERMQNVPTEGVEPLYHPLEIKQRLREDVVTETDQRALLQKSAPLVEAGLYLVPKVIETE